MEPEDELNPDKDDLPLRANTNHILVKHYVLDLSVHFDREVISGNIVMFLEPCCETRAMSKDGTEAVDAASVGEVSQDEFVCKFNHGNLMKHGTKGTVTSAEKMIGIREKDTFLVWRDVGSQSTAEIKNNSSAHLWDLNGDSDFTLVLDCCDLNVTEVEEVDVTSVSDKCAISSKDVSDKAGLNPNFTQTLIHLPFCKWRQKHQLFLMCSRAPIAQAGSPLSFRSDRWSLQVRKKGVTCPQEFPHVIRILYETKPTGGSVRWTKDQDDRVCVYTAGSPINNRALFPGQEPPVAMSTWQATVRAPSDCLVLMSGEEEAVPVEDKDRLFSSWDYYVTMPMPASTFTLAVGHWCQAAEIPRVLEGGVRNKVYCRRTAPPVAGSVKQTEDELVLKCKTSFSGEIMGHVVQTRSGDQTTFSDSTFSHTSMEVEELSVTDYSGMDGDGVSCSHGDYLCRFTEQSAWSQRVIPHRVFGPVSLMHKAQEGVLKLLPRCLAAAYAILGTHPFSRLDVLIVPAGFSSLGMAR